MPQLLPVHGMNKFIADPLMAARAVSASDLFETG
jgi:hypothetical protein